MWISMAGQNMGKLPAESRLSKVRENASHDGCRLRFEEERRRVQRRERTDMVRMAARRLREAPTVLDHPLRVAQFWPFLYSFMLMTGWNSLLRYIVEHVFSVCKYFSYLVLWWWWSLQPQTGWPICSRTSFWWLQIWSYVILFVYLLVLSLSCNPVCDWTLSLMSTLSSLS